MTPISLNAFTTQIKSIVGGNPSPFVAFENDEPDYYFFIDDKGKIHSCCLAVAN